MDAGQCHVGNLLVISLRSLWFALRPSSWEETSQHGFNGGSDILFLLNVKTYSLIGFGVLHKSCLLAHPIYGAANSVSFDRRTWPFNRDLDLPFVPNHAQQEHWFWRFHDVLAEKFTDRLPNSRVQRLLISTGNALQTLKWCRMCSVHNSFHLLLSCFNEESVFKFDSQNFRCWLVCLFVLRLQASSEQLSFQNFRNGCRKNWQPCRRIHQWAWSLMQTK